jgi:hypothetical protein
MAAFKMSFLRVAFQIDPTVVSNCLKIVQAFEKEVTKTFLLQSKLQSRKNPSHSTRTERSSTLGSNSRVSGKKRNRSK